MLPVHPTNYPKFHQTVGEMFVPTSQDLADILGGTDFDLDTFHLF